MKSPEQMGKLPEQPKEEPAKGKEEITERPASPESYNKVEWDRLKQGGPAFAINKGREMGVPQEEINQFAENVIARETENKNYGFVYRFMKNIGIGTEEEVRAAGEQAYRFFLESGDSGSAMSIAEDIYGKDSEEWGYANKTNEAAWEKTKRRRRKEKIEDEEQELNIAISKNATFADLFSAIDAIEDKEGLGELHFEDELLDNFDSKVVEEVLAFQDTQASKATTTKVLDFFKEHGYTQSVVSALLPVKFKQERKKK